MRLSEITTVDALILQLAARGYAKIAGPPDPDQAKFTGLYDYDEQGCPSCGTLVRQITIWPCAVPYGGDVGFAATVDEQGSIVAWFGWESFAGSTLDLDDDLELDSISDALNAWLQEVS